MDEPIPPLVPDFETERLRLRRLTEDDAHDLHRAYGDAETMRYWDAPPSRDVAETEQRIQRSLAFHATWQATWAVLTKDQGSFVGTVNYHARQSWNRRLAVGWILVPEFWGRGYMQEAMQVLIAHCFGPLGTHRMEAEIEPENLRSAQLATRFGFQREGLLRDRAFVSGQPRSVWMYALFRPDWDAFKAK
jgi:[ribosomal protein S5]-alanine N-acetyltransferase